MPVAREGQWNAGCGSLGEDLRTMGEEQRGESNIESAEGSFQVGVSGTKVIDSRDREPSLLGLNHLMCVDQELNPVPPEGPLEFVQSAIPAFMVAQRGENAVPCLDPG